MASISLQVGADLLTTDHLAAGDLTKAKQDMKFLFDGGLAALLDHPLASIPHGSRYSVSLDTGAIQLTPIGSPATFKLDPKFSGAVTIHDPARAPLLTYTKDFGALEAASCAGKAGCIYLITEFQLGVSGNLTASATAGSIGVTTDDSGSASCAVRNYKAFPSNALLRDALTQSFDAFTLPLHPGALDTLADGDCLFYEFDGALNVCFGVTYGVDASAGGFSLSDLGAVLSSLTKFFNITEPSLVSAYAAAGPSVKFNWSRKFQCFLERSQPNPAKPGTATLHLSPGGSTERAVQFTADAGIALLSAPKLSASADTITQWIIQKVYGAAKPPGSAALQDTLDQLKTEVPKYISDANDWLSGLFNKLDPKEEIALALLLPTTDNFLSAFTWHFDLAHPAFAQAWSDATRGDFLEAMDTGAATLDPGSGFEKEHYDSTRLTLTVFGLNYFSSIDTFFTRSTVRYAGNGQFLLETETGKVSATLDFGSKSSTVIYLEGNAAASNAGGALQPSDILIRLHGILSSVNDKTQAARLGALLAGLGSLMQSGGAALAAGEPDGAAPPKANCLHLIFNTGALKRLPSDLPNWSAYTWASDKIPSDPADFLSRRLDGDGNFYKDYSAWAAFNRLANGYTDASGDPDPNYATNRQSEGNPQSAMIQNYFGDGLSPLDAQQLIVYFSAGQQYMNLCADLSAIICQLNPTAAADWNTLVGKLAQTAQADIDPWFGPTVLLALAKSCQPVQVSAPDGKTANPSGTATFCIS